MTNTKNIVCSLLLTVVFGIAIFCCYFSIAVDRINKNKFRIVANKIDEITIELESMRESLIQIRSNTAIREAQMKETLMQFHEAIESLKGQSCGTTTDTEITPIEINKTFLQKEETYDY